MEGEERREREKERKREKKKKKRERERRKRGEDAEIITGGNEKCSSLNGIEMLMLCDWRFLSPPSLHFSLSHPFFSLSVPPSRPPIFSNLFPTTINSGRCCCILHLLGTIPCTKIDGHSCRRSTNLGRGHCLQPFDAHFRNHLLCQCHHQSYPLQHHVTQVPICIQRYPWSLLHTEIINENNWWEQVLLSQVTSVVESQSSISKVSKQTHIYIFSIHIFLSQVTSVVESQSSISKVSKQTHIFSLIYGTKFSSFLISYLSTFRLTRLTFD